MPPPVLRTLLPVEWLIPAEVNGWAIASFCMLHLRKITVAPLPTFVGMTSISSAPRYAVVDSTTHPPKPAVFVTERHTNSSFGAWFTSLGFSADIATSNSSFSRDGASTRLSVSGGRTRRCSTRSFNRRVRRHRPSSTLVHLRPHR